MKICTACNASYPDETLTFCPVDGTTLTPQKDISLDQVPFSYEPGSWSDAAASSEAVSFANQPPPVTASFSAPPFAAPQSYLSAPPSRPKNNATFLFGVVGSIVVVVFVGIIMLAISSGSKSRQTESRTGSITLANGARVRAEPMGTPMSMSGGNTAVVTNAPVSANTTRTNANSSTAVSGKPISRKTDFTGIWKGKFSEVTATLSVTTQNGDTFSGTLSKNGYVVKLTGKIDFEKGIVTMTETEVLQTPGNSKWNLGTNNGTILDDGKSMSGTGSDKNGSYSWSFTKD